MSDIISLKRVWLIIRAHVLTNVWKYVLYALSIPVMVILVRMISYVWDIDLGRAYTSYFVFMPYIVVSFSAIWFSKPLRSAPENAIELIRPYSVFDRILSVIIWVGIIQVGYLIIATYLSILLTTGFFYEDRLLNGMNNLFVFFKMYYGEFFTYIIICSLVVSNVGLCLIYFAGGIFFRKTSWIKTYLILFLSGTVTNCLLFYA